LLEYNSLFDNVDVHVETHMGPRCARTVAPTTARTLQEARALVHGPLRYEAEAQRIWGDVMGKAATDPGSDGSSALLLVWFAVPRLRRTVRRISLRLPADRFDLEAESVLGVLEGVHTVDPLVAGAGEVLLRAAASRAWRFARRTLPERSVPDPAALPQRNLLPPLDAFAVPWTVQITPPDGAEGLAAPIRFAASKERIEGERLGALADGMGLRDVVHRARRPRPGHRIGTVALHPTGVRNEP
jgi:hypothetical protein